MRPSGVVLGQQLGDDHIQSGRPRETQWDATISDMGDCDAAQAVQLIRALCDQLREMTHQLAGVESRDVMR
jgi:hypothetical protein